MTDFIDVSSTWGIAVTLAVYALGTLLHRKTKAVWCNPLLLGSVAMIVLLSVCKIPYADYQESTTPMTWLLFPATVSLAIPLHEQWTLLRRNLAAILGGIAAGVITSIGSILLLSVVFSLDAVYTISLLPKSVTTAVGVDVSAELGGLTALTTTIIVLTGLIGNLMATGMCKWFHITDPIAKGIAIGTSSHAMGTAKALEIGEIEGAMSSLSISVAGILTAILCPVVSALL